MENQHRKISTYRELNQEEIDLMNRSKALEKEVLSFVNELAEYLRKSRLSHALAKDIEGTSAELNRFIDAEPEHWLSIGRTDIQKGFMAITRSIAQPSQ